MEGTLPRPSWGNTKTTIFSLSLFFPPLSISIWAIYLFLSCDCRLLVGDCRLMVCTISILEMECSKITSSAHNDTGIPQATAREQPGIGTTPLTNTDSADGAFESKKLSKRKASRSLSPVRDDFSEVQYDPIDLEAKFDLCGSKKMREVIARMIINDELRLMCVEGNRFKSLFRISKSVFRVPSHSIVAQDCLNLYVAEKNKLKNVLVNSTRSVCLSIATWTSMQKLNYMRLTAHYVDSDWKLQKRILKFCQVPNHMVETIGKTVEMSLLEWNIEKVFTVTTNNASFNDGVVACLSKRVLPVLNGELMRMRYCSNILDLVVAEGLKYYDDSISRIRDVVRYVKASPTRLQKFKAYVEQEKISSNKFVCLDVPNNSDSTYLMLKVAVEFERAFERLEKEDSQYYQEFVHGERSPSHVDWEIARTCVNHLKTFYDASIEFSGNFHITSNLFLCYLAWIHKKLQSWNDSTELHVKNMADNIRKKCNQCWVNMSSLNPLLFVAVLLDPRWKEKGLKIFLHWICGDLLADEMTKKAKKTLDNLYEHYSKLYYTSSKQTDMEIDSGELTIHAQFLMFLKEEDERVELKTEVDRYLAESREYLDDDKFDVLDWWKARPFKCEILRMIVRDVLAIPVSIAISESDFYTSSVILSSPRSSLSSETMEAFVCARNWSCPLA